MSARVPLMVATGNAHKAEEFAALLGPAGFDVVAAPKGFAPIEDGTTFADNARIKAAALQQVLAQSRPMPQQPIILADDSGLVVPALGGAPGVHSARYADAHPQQDVMNRRKLLAALADVQGEGRRGYFVCVLAVIVPGHRQPLGAVHTFEGRVDGAISALEQGSWGFGYDAIFVPHGLQQTFAEAGPEAKMRLSHRSRAIAALLAAPPW